MPSEQGAPRDFGSDVDIELEKFWKMEEGRLDEFDERDILLDIATEVRALRGVMEIGVNCLEGLLQHRDGGQ